MLQLEEEETRISHIINIIKRFLFIEVGRKYLQDSTIILDVNCLTKFFHLLMTKCNAKNLQLNSLRDKYDMTLLMNILISIEEDLSFKTDENLERLVAVLIEEGIFTDDYLSHRARIGLAEQFRLQHLHGVCKITKKKNTLLEKNQFIELKRALKKGENGEYERIDCSVEGQEKMITKYPVMLVNHDGSRDYRRIMISGIGIQDKNDDDPVHDLQIDIHETGGSVVSCSSYCSSNSDFELEEDYVKEKIEIPEMIPQEDVEAKCRDWLSKDLSVVPDGIEDPEIDIKLNKKATNFVPEHLDSQSVAQMTSGETFVTKKNKYKFAPSSTKYADTYYEDIPSKLISKQTNLFLMACKAKKWKVVSAILSLDPSRYPMLLKNYGKGKHPLYHEDASGQNGFFLILEELCTVKKQEQVEILINISKLMISHISNNILNSKHIQKGQTLMKYIKEKNHKNLNEIRKVLEGRLNIQTDYINLTRGISCGFDFQSNDSRIWQCMECSVEVSTNTNLIINDNNHYLK